MNSRIPFLLFFVLVSIFTLSCTRVVKKTVDDVACDTASFVGNEYVLAEVKEEEEVCSYFDTLFAYDDHGFFETVTCPIEAGFLFKNFLRTAREMNKTGEFESAFLIGRRAMEMYQRMYVVIDSSKYNFSYFSTLYKSILREYNHALVNMEAIPEDIYSEDLSVIVGLGDDTTLNISTEILRNVNYTIPVVLNSDVISMINFFTGRGRNTFENWMERKSMYAESIYRILDEHSLPRELIFIAMIESGFRNRAVSRARAVGMWQFMTATAREYGAQINYWIDERRNFIKSTRKAANFMADLYNRFGDWYFVFASYNGGPNRVARLKNQFNTDNFWDIYYFLPRETRMYVSSFIACLIISSNLEYFGFKNITPKEPLDFTTYPVKGGILLSYIATLAQTPIEIMKELNAELIAGATPPTEGQHLVKIPRDKMEIFAKNYNESPKREKVLLVRHTVRSGDNLWTLARAHRTTVRAIVDANNRINERTVLRIGDVIIIPVPVRAIAR